MNFKDFVAQDIRKTFFNTGEFSDLVIIDGQECAVMIDSERLIKRSEKEYEGVTAGLILYFIPVSSFSKKPKVGNSQIFNNQLHYIDSVADNDGIYEIVINQNRGE
jgi:hypothetical protein